MLKICWTFYPQYSTWLRNLIWALNEPENLHFDNEQDLHISSETYEAKWLWAQFRFANHLALNASFILPCEKDIGVSRFRLPLQVGVSSRFPIRSRCRLLGLLYPTRKTKHKTRKQKSKRQGLTWVRPSIMVSLSLPSLLIRNRTSTKSVSGSLSWSPSCFQTADCFRYQSNKRVIIVFLRWVKSFHFHSSPCKSKRLSTDRQTGIARYVGSCKECSKLFPYLSEILELQAITFWKLGIDEGLVEETAAGIADC